MTEGLDAHQKHVALRRVGTATELTHLIAFLASDESSFCTGAEFVADGGETGRPRPRSDLVKTSPSTKFGANPPARASGVLRAGRGSWAGRSRAR
jgi:hypothetical protein